MKHLLYFLFAFVLTEVAAQPIITGASNIIPAGNTFDAKYSIITDLGPTGPSEVWDFSTESFVLLTSLSIVDPSSTTFAGDFPTANWAYEAGSWTAYFEQNTSGFYNLAFNITNPGGTGDYSADSRKILQFPFTYGSTYVDSYTESSTSKDLTVSYEGAGTLIMPGGYTYQEVVRIREEEENGEAATRYYTLNPFMNIAVHFSENSIFTWIVTPASASLEDQAPSSFSVSPNPVDDVLHIYQSTPGISSYQLIDLNGSIVLQVEQDFSTSSLLDLRMLQSGIYFISDGRSRIKIMKL